MSKKAMPISLVSSNSRKTKAEIAARTSAEPGGCSAVLAPPTNLSKAARAEWKRLIGLYRQLDTDVINDLDINLLAAYCESSAIFKAAQKKYKEEDLVVYNKSGTPIENPYLTIMRKEAANMAKHSELLCLSPVGRARMGLAVVKKQDENDPMAEFFSNRKK